MMIIACGSLVIGGTESVVVAAVVESAAAGA